jgi:hypothetical protein
MALVFLSSKSECGGLKTKMAANPDCSLEDEDASPSMGENSYTRNRFYESPSRPQKNFSVKVQKLLSKTTGMNYVFMYVS